MRPPSNGALRMVRTVRSRVDQPRPRAGFPWPTPMTLELPAFWRTTGAMPHAFKVTGHTLVEGLGFTAAKHTDYEIMVSFERWEDNQETLENFVAWYWSIDLKAHPHERWRVLTAENCARALAVFHFRERFIRFHVTSVEYSAVTPSRQPTVETSTFRLWETKAVVKEIFTALNAAWELYRRCEFGKISVPDAKALIREKFPGQYFAWHEVLRAFSKEGGRHTDKYLRRD